jgi:hypothetical protein
LRPALAYLPDPQGPGKGYFDTQWASPRRCEAARDGPGLGKSKV